MANPDRPIYAKTALPSRRWFLGVGSAVLLAACLPKQEVTQPVEAKGIKKELGEWSQQEIEALAVKMMSELQFNDIAHAGRVLLDNQQQGGPSFSRFSPIFFDYKVRVSNVRDINPAGAGMGVSAPAMASIREITPRIGVSVRSRANGATERISVPPALKFEEIQFNNGLVSNYSDFLIELYMAKEVMNADALGMVTSYIASNVFYTRYYVPQDTRTRNGIQASMINSGFGEIPSSFMADLWAHYLLVPNYLIALEQGKFPTSEAEGDEVRIFKLAAEVFQEDGVLTRNSEGIYEWTKDSDKFFGTWIDFSIAGFKALRPK